MTRQKTYTGKILLAEPFLWDTNFKRSAVLICDHSKKEGTVGFIINKPMDIRVDELVNDFPAFDSTAYFGGPVQTDTIHYIHNAGELLEGSTKITEGVYWGGDFEKLKFLIDQQLIKPENIRFFVGYAGWSEGQLEMEMKIRSWIVADVHSNYLFKSSPHVLWQKIMNQKGDNFTVIAQIPDSFTWN
jgi:putative transcriptional regulator